MISLFQEKVRIQIYHRLLILTQPAGADSGNDFCTRINETGLFLEKWRILI